MTTLLAPTEPDEDVRSLLAALLEQRRQDWRLEAACRGMDPETFFPPRGVRVDEAKAICAGCPVRSQCLDDALADGRSEHFGIWGGVTEKSERRSGAHDAGPILER